jgi:hypothetical protein
MVGPVPADMGFAIGAHVVALLGVGGKMETHLRALGDGALAAFAVRSGVELGAKKAAPAGASPTSAAGQDWTSQGQDWGTYGADDDDDDDDDNELEGMALDPSDFAGIEIL